MPTPATFLLGFPWNVPVPGAAATHTFGRRCPWLYRILALEVMMTTNGIWRPFLQTTWVSHPGMMTIKFEVLASVDVPNHKSFALLLKRKVVTVMLYNVSNSWVGGRWNRSLHFFPGCSMIRCFSACKWLLYSPFVGVRMTGTWNICKCTQILSVCTYCMFFYVMLF